MKVINNTMGKDTYTELKVTLYMLELSTCIAQTSWSSPGSALTGEEENLFDIE